MVASKPAFAEQFVNRNDPALYPYSTFPRHHPRTGKNAGKICRKPGKAPGKDKTQMSNLVLELRQGDMMVVNGAAIRFRTRSRIELTAHARFLFGRQIMAPTEADTPARRIYFALQTAYIGDEQERKSGLADAEILIQDFKGATTSRSAIALLDSALSLARADKCYHALRLARRVVRHEDAVLGRKDGPAPAEALSA